MSDEYPDTVWIGEAWDIIPDGEDQRVERVVHLTEDDCREDIRTLAESGSADYIRVDEKNLLTGTVGL